MRHTGVLTRFLIGLVLIMGMAQNGAASVEPELTMAVRDKNIRQVQTLLARGANVNERDEGLEQTPLMRAAQVGERTIARLLLTYRADVNARDGAGNTALLFAVQRGDAGMVRLLLERGADVYDRDSEGFTVLKRGIEKGDKTIVTLLQQAAKKRRNLEVPPRYAANSMR